MDRFATGETAIMKPASQEKEGAKKQPAPLSTSLEDKLGAYSVAAIAAGVGLLALTPRAAAKIVYKAAHVKIANSSFYLILNHEAIPDFVISNVYGSSSGGNHFAGLTGHALGSKNFFETSRTNVGGGYLMDPAALKRGARIPTVGGLAALRRTAACSNVGPTALAESAFLGTGTELRTGISA